MYHSFPFSFPFRIEKQNSPVCHFLSDLCRLPVVWNWYDLQITVRNLLKRCCYSDLHLCHLTPEFLFIHENMKQHSSSEIKRTIKQNTQILHRINKKTGMRNWKAPAFLALFHLSFTHNRLSHHPQGRSIFAAAVWFFCCGTSRPPRTLFQTPAVVISTWSTKVRLTFQFSRWQVKAEQGELMVDLFFWCVWSVWENKEFSPKCLLGLGAKYRAGHQKAGNLTELQKIKIKKK